MRLLYGMELVLALGVGLGLARYRLTWPEHEETFGALSWADSFEIGSDSILAGVGLVGGLATLAERVQAKSSVRWGPGRWVWFVVASYLVLTTVDKVLGTIAFRFQAVYIQNSLSTEIIRGFRGRYGEFLLPPMTWFLTALGLTALAGRTQPNPILDGREYGGRAFAAVLVSIGLGLRALVLFGIRPQVMGGGG